MPKEQKLLTLLPAPCHGDEELQTFTPDIDLDAVLSGRTQYVRCPKGTLVRVSRKKVFVSADEQLQWRIFFECPECEVAFINPPVDNDTL